MSRKPEGIDLLSGVRGFDQQLDHQRDAAGVDVIHLGKVQQNQLHIALGQHLVSAQDRIFRGAGDIALEAQDDDRMPGW